MNGLFFTGTDTGVGKTRVVSAMVRSLREQGHRAGAYKPAVSGARFEGDPPRPIWDDVEELYKASQGAFPRDCICPQTFLAPLAPPVAAAREGREVDAGILRTGADRWRHVVDVLAVEGAGGFLSPISSSDLVADVARDLGLPLIIVGRAGLGTINHVLLTIEAARSRGMTIAGVILNESRPPDEQDRSRETNAAEITRWSGVPVLAVLDYVPEGDLLRLPACRRIDWLRLAAVSRSA